MVAEAGTAVSLLAAVSPSGHGNAAGGSFRMTTESHPAWVPWRAHRPDILSLA